MSKNQAAHKETTPDAKVKTKNSKVVKTIGSVKFVIDTINNTKATANIASPKIYFAIPSFFINLKTIKTITIEKKQNKGTFKTLSLLSNIICSIVLILTPLYLKLIYIIIPY